MQYLSSGTYSEGLGVSRHAAVKTTAAADSNGSLANPRRNDGRENGPDVRALGEGAKGRELPRKGI